MKFLRVELSKDGLLSLPEKERVFFLLLEIWRMRLMLCQKHLYGPQLELMAKVVRKITGKLQTLFFSSDCSPAN